MIVEPFFKEKKKQDAKRFYSFDQYIELEEKSVEKHEFVNGKMIPMAGGTFNHMILGGTLCALLMARFFDSEEVLTYISNDFKIYIPDHHRAVYADGSVVIGDLEMFGKGKQAYTNPTLIIEVLSKSTEKYDRSGKFRMYQTLSSFKEYVLVNQYAPVVEVFLKIEENKWQMISYVGLDKVVKFDTLGVELSMADIYKKAKDLQDPQFEIDFPEEENGEQ